MNRISNSKLTDVIGCLYRHIIVHEICISLFRAVTKLKVESKSVHSTMFGITVAMYFTSVITLK